MADPSPSSKAPRARAVLQLAIVAGLLLAGVGLLYGPRWQKGETIFRGVVQEQYYLLGQYAFEHKVRQDFQRGLFPLWNEYNGLGTPLLGNMMSGVFYPLKPIIYFATSLAARDFYIVLRLLIAALLAYALARRLGLHFAPAAAVALAFSLTGYFKMFVNENYLNADVLLPGLVLFSLRLADHKRLRDLLILALLIFAVLNNGHPEAAFYALLLPAFLVPMRARNRADAARGVLLFSAAVSLGLLLTLPMLLPFIEYWGRGWHFHVPGAGFFHFAADQAAAVASPWFFGQAPAGAPFIATPNIQWVEGAGMIGYAASAVPWLFPGLGLVTALLAGLGASLIRRLTRTESAMAAYSIFFLGVMFGLPLFRLVGHVPVFSFSGNFKHPLPAVALTAALLAGRGLQEVMARRASRRRVAWTVAVIGGAFGLLVLLAEPLPGGGGRLNPWSAANVALFMLASGLLYWRASGNSRFAAPAVIGCLLISLVLDGHQQPMRDPAYEKRIEAGDAYSQLEMLNPRDRVYISQDLAPPNLNILYGLADIRVMDGVNDRRLVEAVNYINGHDRNQAGDYWYRTVGYLQPMPEKLGHPLLRLFNVKYFLTDGPLPYNLTINRVLGEAKVLAPAPGYVGRARLLQNGFEAPGLYQHPPSRVSWRIDPPPPASDFLLLQPGVTRDARRSTDGLSLLVQSGDDLAYARHLNPRKVPGDSRIPPLWMPGAGLKPDLHLISLPGADNDFDQAGWMDLRLGPGPKPGPPDFILLAQGATWLYQDPHALPRAFVTLDPPLEMDDAATQGLQQTGRVLSLSHTAQQVTIKVESEAAGTVVLSDLYYPGWRAQVDGKPARVRRALGPLRAVDVEAGEHEVTMTYEPASFAIGLWAALAVVMVLSAGGLVRRKRNAKEPGKPR